MTWFLRKVAAVVVGESFGLQRSIASVAFPLLPTRDRLRCLATGVGVGRIFRSSMSFSSVENGVVKPSVGRPKIFVTAANTLLSNLSYWNAQ